MTRRKSSVLVNSQDYLWGLRAILAVQSFAWVFFKVFNPALTIPGATTTGEHVPVASPSSLPGVFGGPGIVARDVAAGNLSKSISPDRTEMLAGWEEGNGETSGRDESCQASAHSTRRLS
jgi:hypothetical protein